LRGRRHGRDRAGPGRRIHRRHRHLARCAVAGPPGALPGRIPGTRGVTRRLTPALGSCHPMTDEVRRVRQMRLVVEAADYDEALSFYRDFLGLPEELAFSG